MEIFRDLTSALVQTERHTVKEKGVFERKESDGRSVMKATVNIFPTSRFSRMVAPPKICHVTGNISNLRGLSLPKLPLPLHE